MNQYLVKFGKIQIIISILVGIFLISSLIIHEFYFKAEDFTQITEKFQKVYDEKSKNLQKELIKLSEINPDSVGQYYSLNSENHFFIFKNDSLIFWSKNKVSVSPYYDENGFNNSILKFNNGWYKNIIYEKNNIIIVGLFLIKNDYQYENEYLNNSFNPEFKLNNSIGISFNKNEYPIIETNGDIACNLDFPEKLNPPVIYINLLFLLFYGTYIFLMVLILSLYQSFRNVIRNRNWLLLFVGIDLILLNLLITYFKIPRALFESYLFSPEHFASNMYLSSIGKFLLNSSLALFVAIAFFKFKLFDGSIKLDKSTSRYLYIIAVIGGSYFLFYLSYILSDYLFMDSIISYDLTRITKINFISLLGFLIYLMLIVSLILLTIKPLFFSATLYPSYISTIIVFLIQFLILFIVHFIWLKTSPLLFVFFELYLLLFFIIYRISGRDKKFYATLSFILFFALFSGFTLYHSNQKKERDNREMIAIDLAKKRDPLLEYLFDHARKKMKNDQVLDELLSEYPFNEKEDYDDLTAYLIDQYYYDISNTHDLIITFCDESDVLNFQPDGYYVGCNIYFDSIIKARGKYSGKGLFYIDYELNADNYLGIISKQFEDKSISIYIEMYAKNIPKGLGYPELLKPQKDQGNRELMDYSWAKYENNRLVRHHGEFFYNISIEKFVNDPYKKRFIESQHYSHLIYPSGDDSIIIISKPLPDILDITTPFSYFLLFFGLIAVIFSLFGQGIIKIRLFDPNLKSRIQMSFVLMLVFSLLIIGGSSLVYISSLNHKKNHDFLDEKSHSVLIELEHKLAVEEKLIPDMQEYLDGLLYKFSLVFFSDINLYDLNGSLFSSSRPEIFEKGLVSEKMSEQAFYNLNYNELSLYIQEEEIGDYKYLSAYLPFRNVDNITIAYLNLPYFAKQDEITNDLSAFIATIINIDIILIAIAIIIALIISNYITKPVQILREKIGHIRLGEKNEKIDWEKRDEIGDLVVEYNRMLEELEHSATLLAKSERESAWREVAKQVAHEIKNPLTPMKLSVQYLQKAWNEKTPDWDQRLKKFTETITEQINTLSKIASDFSDFAKMPKAKKSPVSLVEVISNAINLFKNSTNISIEFDFEKNEDFILTADKEQLLRVFNNLIKNSIQAIQEEKKGVISINLIRTATNYQLSFKDNGIGIPIEEKDMIFSPNFTTKSGGMGIGLSMVKNIIIAQGGTIEFESEKGRGTIFIISLPIN